MFWVELYFITGVILIPPSYWSFTWLYGHRGSIDKIAVETLLLWPIVILSALYRMKEIWDESKTD